MNLSWRQQNQQCVNVADNIQLKQKRAFSPEEKCVQKFQVKIQNDASQV